MKNRETKIIYLSDTADVDNIKSIEEKVKKKNLKNILFAKIHYPEIIKSFIEANKDKKITLIFDTHGDSNGNLLYENNVYSITQLIQILNLNNNHEVHFFCCHAGSKNNLQQLSFLSNQMQDSCPIIFLHSGSAKVLQKFSSDRIFGMMKNKALALLTLEPRDEINFIFPETINILRDNNIYRISPFEMYKYKDVEYDFFDKDKINYIGALENIIFNQKFISSCTLDSIEKTLMEQNIAELEQKFIINQNFNSKLKEAINDYLAIGIYLMAYRYCNKNINNPDKDYKLDKIIKAISRIEYKNDFLLAILDDYYFKEIATHKTEHYSKILRIFKEDYQIIPILLSEPGRAFINNNFNEFYKILSEIKSPFILKNTLESNTGGILFNHYKEGFFTLLGGIKDESAKTSFLNGLTTRYLMNTDLDKIFNLANELKFEKNLVSFLQSKNGETIATIDPNNSAKLLKKIRDKSNIVDICNSKFGENLVQNNKDPFLEILENLDKDNSEYFLSTIVCEVLMESIFKVQKFSINININNKKLYIRNFKQSNIKALNIDKKFSSAEESESSLGKFSFQEKRSSSRQDSSSQSTGSLIINFKDYQNFANYIITKSKTRSPANLVVNPKLEALRARFAGASL